MKKVVCDSCDKIFDSEDDPGCFDLCGDGIHCENCRERAYVLHQERLMENGPGPSLLDQQIEAMKYK